MIEPEVTNARLSESFHEDAHALLVVDDFDGSAISSPVYNASASNEQARVLMGWIISCVAGTLPL